MSWALPPSRDDPKDEIPIDRWIVVGALALAMLSLFLGDFAAVFCWSLGPGLVASYFLFLALGWVDTDGFRFAVLGLLFTLFLLPAGVVVLLGGRLSSLLLLPTVPLEALTVVVGAMAIRHGRESATDDDPRDRLRARHSR